MIIPNIASLMHSLPEASGTPYDRCHEAIISG